MGLHAYGVDDVPPGSEPAEQRKKTDSGPDPSSATVCVWWRNSQLSIGSKQWEPYLIGEGERERSWREIDQSELCVEKVHPSPPFIGQGEVQPLLPFPCGTKPTREEGALAKGGGRPPFGAKAQGGASPFPLMGPMRPMCPFSLLFIYLNSILIFNSVIKH